MRPRDSQVSAVYKWEDELRLGLGNVAYKPAPSAYRKVYENLPRGEERRAFKTLDCDEVLSIVEPFFRSYCPSERTPAIKFLQNNRFCASYTAGYHVIELPEWARVAPVVLHETCHAVLYTLERRRETPVGPDHGPVFARMLAEGLQEFCGIPLDQAVEQGESQRPRRVRFASPEEMPRRLSPKDSTRITSLLVAKRFHLRKADEADDEIREIASFSKNTR